jgi:hypothetical protein
MRFADDDPRSSASNGDDSEWDASLDEEFPLGDGTADTEATVICPYCSEAVTIALDVGGGAAQEYVEDCEVCCRPWQVSVVFRGGEASVSVRALDE